MQGPDFHFEMSEVEIARVNCTCFLLLFFFFFFFFFFFVIWYLKAVELICYNFKIIASSLRQLLFFVAGTGRTMTLHNVALTSMQPVIYS